MPKRSVSHEEYLRQQLKEDPELAIAYLKEAAQNEDPRALGIAVRHVVDSQLWSEGEMANVANENFEFGSSNDYSKFSYIFCNRPVKETDVKKLVLSITEQDLTESERIFVADDWDRPQQGYFKIVDGQHRYLACYELKKPIYYKLNKNIKSKEDAIKALKILNTHQNPWIRGNYIEYYAWLDDENYKRLINDAEECSLKTGSFATLLNKNFNIVKDGRMVYTEKESKEIRAFMYEALVICKTLKNKDVTFLRALRSFYKLPRFSWQTLLKQSERYGADHFRKRSSLPGYQEELENLYNYNRPVNNRLRGPRA